MPDPSPHADRGHPNAPAQSTPAAQRLPRFARPLAMLMAAAFLSLPVAAQDDGPALNTDGGRLDRAQTPATADEMPALSAPSSGRRGSTGTTVLGEDESPIGLYIIPWRASAPDPELDRPARFVDAYEEPVDALQFERFVEYYDALSRHRAAQMAAEGAAANGR